MKTRRSRRKRNAFTLIEVLVATVVMTILVGLVIQVTNEVLKVWNRATGTLSANFEARIAMDLLTQDLEAAIFRNNQQQWLRAEKEIVNGPTGFRPQTVKLKMFSPAIDRPEGEPGEVCGIAYKLDFRDPVNGESGSPGERTFILYRSLVPPDETFENLLGPDNQSSLETGEYWTDDAIRGSDPSNTEAKGSNYLAGNIVEFRLDFFILNPIPTNETEEKVLNLTKEGLPRVVYGGSDATVGPQSPVDRFRAPLEYVDITLTVLSDQGMQILQRLDEGLAGTGYEDVDPETAEEIVVRENSTIFKRRVFFQSRPL